MVQYIKNGNDLLNKELSQEEHLIPDLIPFGLTLLVGRPKIGKSTFLYNICFDFCSGNAICNLINCSPGVVLYITFEDNERKIQKLAKNISNNDLSNFFYSINFPTQEQGGVEKLESYLENNQNIKLVCIDTMVKFSPSSKASYGGSYNRLEKLHNLSHEYNIAIVLTHHTRKMVMNQEFEEDDFENILGSQGLRGLVDNTIFINSEYVKVEGREIEEFKYSLKKENLRFKLNEYSKDLGAEDRRYIDFIWDKGRPVTLKEIYEQFSDKKSSTIRNRLKTLINDGRLAKPTRGEYEIGPYYDHFF